MKIKVSELIEMLVEERELLEEKIQAINNLIDAYRPADDLLPTPAKEDSVQSGKRKCKTCGSPGCRSDRCPKNGSASGEIEPRCNRCALLGHSQEECTTEIANSPEVTGSVYENVQRLKEEGKTSLEIAKELKISLYFVNKNWLKREPKQTL